MYAIRTTPGFIIDSRPYGEAGKLISIFTRDLGLVSASAVGIRFECSKLRYHAQDYSFGSFSLVRGKEFWRLTSAATGFINEFEGPFGADSPKSCKANAHTNKEDRFPRVGENEARRADRADAVSRESFVNPGAYVLIARIALLLRRLLQGEEPDPGLFACIESAAHFIHGHDDPDELNEERLKALESLIVIRIMHHLGYIGDIADMNGHVSSLGLSGELLDSLKEKRISMNRHINAALKESHL